MAQLFAALFSVLPSKADSANGNPSSPSQPAVFLITGAGGEEEFGFRFEEWAARWEAAVRKANARLTRIGSATNAPSAPDAASASAKGADSTDRDRLKTALENESRVNAPELWLVFIGHGTFDGTDAKFNLRGLDISARELAEWLKPFKRPIAVINTSSASAPFINALSAQGRVIITATRSGHEQNFAYFGEFMAESIADRKADLDKDGQISLLEAFLNASRKTAEFYDVEGRMATEHALLDDTGDGLGTPADFFRGIRAVKKPAENAALDGLRAHQWHLIKSDAEALMPAELRNRRDALELELEGLRQQKLKLDPAEYYSKLEKLLLQLSEIYETSSPGN